MRRSGMVSPNKAARMLGICPNTVRAWAEKAWNGQESKLKKVEKNTLTGYFFISIEDVKKLVR